MSTVIRFALVVLACFGTCCAIILTLVCMQESREMRAKHETPIRKGKTEESNWDDIDVPMR